MLQFKSKKFTKSFLLFILLGETTNPFFLIMAVSSRCWRKWVSNDFLYTSHVFTNLSFAVNFFDILNTFTDDYTNFHKNDFIWGK